MKKLMIKHLVEEMLVFPIWQKANSKDRKIITKRLARKQVKEIIEKAAENKLKK